MLSKEKKSNKLTQYVTWILKIVGVVWFLMWTPLATCVPSGLWFDRGIRIDVFQQLPRYISSGEVPGLFCFGDERYLHIQVEHVCGCQSFPCGQENLWQQWHLPSPLSCYLLPIPRDTGHPRVAGGHCNTTPGPVQAPDISGLQKETYTIHQSA